MWLCSVMLQSVCSKHSSRSAMLQSLRYNHSSSSRLVCAATRRCFSSNRSSSGRPSPTCLIVGGGIAGVSLSWQLALRGMPVTLLEKSKFLCAGATWHAAGLVTRFAGSPKLKKLHVRALDVLNQLQDEHDVSLHRPGSLRIIEKGNKTRWQEAKQHVNMAALYDDPSFPTRFVSPQEVQSLHPLVDPSGIECAIWTEKDGDIDPTTLVNCLAKLAKAAGAKYHLDSEVVAVERLEGGRFAVTTSSGARLEADLLVNAAGLWSKRLSALVDPQMPHPAFIIEHQYAITDAIPAVVSRMATMGETGRLPVLRDLAGSSYIRQEGSGLLVGPYEKNCRLAPPDWTNSPPANFEFDLFQEQMTEIEENLCSAMKLLPVLAEVGWKKVINGPTIWTGDSLPRCGPSPSVPNYWDFNTLTYGIAQSIPLAEYLSHYMCTGEQPFDLSAQCAPARYGRWATDGYVKAVVRDTYAKNNCVSFGAFENRPAGRTELACRTDPLHQALLKRGGVMSFSLSGVETPLVYCKEEERRATLSEQHSFSHFAWAQDVALEAKQVLQGVGLAHASFSKLTVTGNQAEAFLDWVGTNEVPSKVGTTRLTYFLTSAGKVNAEFTVAKIQDNDYYLVGTRDYAGHDTQWLASLARESKWAGQVSVADVSSEVEILHLAGPKSRALLESACPGLPSIPFLQFRSIQVAGVQVKCFRVSFSGLHGFELHCPSGGPAAVVYQALWSSPATPSLQLSLFGTLALNSLRQEVGFKVKADLDYAHYTEAGIDFFIGKAKRIAGGAFLGQDSTHTPQRQAALFRVQTKPGFEWSIVSDCPIWCGQQVVGFTTSAAPGARTGATLAQGYLLLSASPPVSTETEGLWLECYGERWPVELLAKPASAVTGRQPFPE
eukprot:gb/GEZN01001619.1/.p1 GENE.gb/GEZN01001619.1/~~gb/GEZN01001619.1/.p1  ORF type:complete len:889 (-),score=152.49 gb/GEZN01001619.1/:126-2792(-)